LTNWQTGLDVASTGGALSEASDRQLGPLMRAKAGEPATNIADAAAPKSSSFIVASVRPPLQIITVNFVASNWSGALAWYAAAMGVRRRAENKAMNSTESFPRSSQATFYSNK
jgi:hypothetical protein